MLPQHGWGWRLELSNRKLVKADEVVQAHNELGSTGAAEALVDPGEEVEEVDDLDPAAEAEAGSESLFRAREQN